ncbi:MAG: PqqD family protein [Oscillospiraceae bacterium]|nr:PqqD family protein [Oscillospiraceae bacterium]
MKLRGEFVIRQVMDCIAAIPVGSTALQFNGMILLNDVSRVIWDCLSAGSSIQDITAAVTEAFEVSPEEAEADIVEFTEKLRSLELLD